MKRVLFVDDERKVLDGLRRLLHPLRSQWEMEFAPTGAAAIEHLDTATFDVVVADLHLAGSSGRTVLAHCHETSPQAVRVAFSGRANMESVARSMEIAHQFLAKPWDATAMRQTLQRAEEIQQMLADTQLRSLLGEIQNAPLFPKTYATLSTVLDDPDVSLADVAAVIEADPLLTAKVLQLSNSAAMGLIKPVTNLASALSVIGIEVLRSLVLFVEVTQPIGETKTAKLFSGKEYRAHSMQVAQLAQRIVGSRGLRRETFTIGMLHDLGDLALAVQAPDLFDSIATEAKETERFRVEVEYERIGSSHAELGAYLLGLWGVPQSIVAAVAHHHRPTAGKHGELTAELAVHIADALLHEMPSKSDHPPTASLNLDVLCTAGLDHKIDSWRDLAIQDSNAHEETLHV